MKIFGGSNSWKYKMCLVVFLVNSIELVTYFLIIEQIIRKYVIENKLFNKHFHRTKIIFRKKEKLLKTIILKMKNCSKK